MYVIIGLTPSDSGADKSVPLFVWGRDILFLLDNWGVASINLALFDNF